MARNIRKLFQRRFYTFLNTNYGFLIVFLSFFIVFKSILNLFIGNTCVHTAHWGLLYQVFAIKPVFCSEKSYSDNIGAVNMEEYLSYEPIDIVYTWVNGSDPIWLSKKNEYLYRNDPVARNATVRTGNSANNTAAVNETSLNKENADSNRYRDSNELKYSLRSIEKNAPWVRHVYIVTDNQVPHWLNLENDRLTVVSHSEIFQNKSHLPVFSSPAIESHLHEIPGISKKFIYFNDDVFLGTTVTPEDFVSVSGVQKFIMSWDVPKCAPGCAESWIGDGYCDKACNVSECNFDFPDCVGGGKRNHGTSSGSRSASNPVQCSQGCPDSWLADKVCDNKCKTLECGFDMGDCGISLIKENYPGVVLQPHVPTSIASYSTLYDSEVHALSSSGAVYVHAHVANSTNTYLIFPHEASTYINETDVALRAPTEIYVPRIVGAEEDLSYTNITNASAANSTTVKTSPTNLVSPVVLRVPYGSANVVYFNLSLLACVSHLMHLDPLGEPPYQSGSGGDAPNGNYSESEWDVRFGVLGGYYPNINGTGSSNGDELTDTVIPSSIDDDATTDGDSAADANSYYPFQELDYQYVESMCNLTQIRGNIASGGDEFVYTHAEYDVDGVVHFASILSQHHTLAVILYHGEYPSNSNDPRTVDPPSSYPYDTTITVSGYNKRNNVNVSTSFKLRVEEPIDMEVPMKSKWYSKHEKWYFRMPMPLSSQSLSGSESLQNSPSGSSSDSVPMKPIHGFSSACFESDPLKLKESSKIRVTDTVSLLKKPFVYRGAASTSTHSKNVEGIVLALDMWSADTFRTRLNEVLDRNDNAEAEIGLTHQLQGIEEIMDKTAISEVLVEYTVTSGDGNHSSFSMPLLELLGFINKRGIVMPLPRGSAPRTLSDAVAKTKELHSHYSSTRKWHGTTPHSDPLTKPEVMALTSKLLSSPDSDTETTTHNVLLLVLPMPVPSEGTPLDSWFHIKWDIVVPPSYDAHRNFQMNGTQAVTTAKQNSTEMSISEHARSCGCGVVSFQWGSLVLPPDVEGSGVSGDAASVEISSNHTDAHAHSIIIADTSTAEVDVDGVVGKQNTSVFSQDIALEASSTSLNSSIGTIEEAAEDCVGGSIRRRLQSAASNLRGVSKASPVEMSTTATRSKVSWIAHIVPEYLASNTAPYAPTETTTQPVDIMALMEKYVYMHGREEDSSVEDIQIMEDPGFSSAYRMLPQNQRRRRLVDTYAQSLVHVNRLYSKVCYYYLHGLCMRHVFAHCCVNVYRHSVLKIEKCLLMCLI